ncbi:MAG: DUF4058 family protein [Planctomycetes bacterium]|nr:DUF4058 family protein [Planctomycetota bacterium]
MPSPFPGMDPYLENPAFWPDFHARFITYWCDTLRELLPEQYEARVDERVNLVEVHPEHVKLIAPDVSITRDASATMPASEAKGVATIEPTVIPLAMEEGVRETYIEIRRRPERTLIAVLELLSPSNKEEPGRSIYLAKRNALLHQDVHLVELDLLLADRRLPLAGPYPAGDYFALVSRSDRRPDCHVFAWTIREPLPTIPIPLRSPDRDIAIDLGAVFTQNYDRGGYRRSLIYQAPPDVKLPPQDLSWVVETALHAGR